MPALLKPGFLVGSAFNHQAVNDLSLMLFQNFLLSSGSGIADARILGPELALTRASSGTYFDENGVLVAAATDAPRFDHDPVAGAARGLLIEEERENVCLQSEDLETTWTIPGANTTITANAGVAPDGATTADDVLHGDTAETIQQTITITATTFYTISAFVKQGTTGAHDFVKIAWIDDSAGANGFEAWFNISAGTVGTAQATGTGSYTAGSATIADVGNGWFRISARGRITGGQIDARLEISNTTADAVDTAEATNSVLWWGLQAEIGQFASSYIPVTTAAVTRSIDICSTTGMDWFNATKGTFFVSFDARNGLTSNSFPHAFSVDDGTFDERYAIWHASGGKIEGGITSGGSLAGRTTPDVTVVLGTPAKAAFTYSGTADMIGVTNAVLSVQDTSYVLAVAPTTLRLGNSSEAHRTLNGHIAAIKYWNIRKSDAFLQNISG